MEFISGLDILSVCMVILKPVPYSANNYGFIVKLKFR